MTVEDKKTTSKPLRHQVQPNTVDSDVLFYLLQFGKNKIFHINHMYERSLYSASAIRSSLIRFVDKNIVERVGLRTGEYKLVVSKSELKRLTTL